MHTLCRTVSRLAHASALRTVSLVAILTLPVLTVPAHALDIRIDLSTQSSATTGNWNNITDVSGTTNGLTDFSTGLATGVSLTGSANWSNFIGDANGAFANADWLIQPATVDGAGLSSGSGTFTFAGLTGSSYQVELVSARTSFGYLNSFDIGGAGADRTYLGTAVVDPWNSATDGLAASNWLIWDNLTPIGGQLVITDVTVGTLGILNAIRITDASAPPSVPEPGTWALFGTGLVFALSRRRKS